jgi:hypothetical protein
MSVGPALNRRGLEVFTENPFVGGVQTRTRPHVLRQGNRALINTDTGDTITRAAGFWEIEEVDAGRFVKLFIQGVKALKELSGSGTKVFELLYLKVQETPNQDKIFIPFSNIDQKITPMSEATYHRGMKEILGKGFLAPTPSMGLYWLNPGFVWNGDRLAFVKEYRRKPAIKTDQPPLFPEFSEDAF